MPSPFPGMSPYLEHPDDWRGFHSSYLVHLSVHPVRRLSHDYAIKIEQSLHISSKSLRRGDRFAVADIGVIDEGAPPRSGGVAVAAPETAAAAVAAPVRGTVPFSRGFRKNRWLSVVNRRTRRIVTVIELLSPANKVGGGRDQYLVKRLQLLASDCNLVEIDPLRGGLRMPLAGVPASDYLVVVSRPADRPAVDAWPIGLRQALPAIPVPVAAGASRSRRSTCRRCCTRPTTPASSSGPSTTRCRSRNSPRRTPSGPPGCGRNLILLWGSD